MNETAIATAIDTALEGRHLLDHPYYRDWQEGRLTMGDLAEYSAQYRHFEACLPTVLETVAATATADAGALVRANLADERANPRPHTDLFEAFARAVGAPDTGMSTATAALVGLYTAAAASGPVAALAVVGAYETQAADIARTKAESLATHYGVRGEDAEFWTVHADIEADHAAWTDEALTSLGAEGSEVQDWATRSAAAWWDFLDERQGCRAA